MIAQEFIQILIYIHAGLGALALMAGMISIATKKGALWHRTSGKVFYYAMLSAAVFAMTISCLPEHQNPFLFAIGIFSAYFVITGYRALKFKFKNPDLKWDKVISWIMIITGILMVLLPIIINHSIHIILSVFGLLGLAFAFRDLLLFKDEEKLKEAWLKQHLTKMMAGYISATTAFVVVNEFFPSFYGWFIPGIIGGGIIAFWQRKIKRKEA